MHGLPGPSSRDARGAVLLPVLARRPRHAAALPPMQVQQGLLHQRLVRPLPPACPGPAVAGLARSRAAGQHSRGHRLLPTLLRLGRHPHLRLAMRGLPELGRKIPAARRLSDLLAARSPRRSRTLPALLPATQHDRAAARRASRSSADGRRQPVRSAAVLRRHVDRIRAQQALREEDRSGRHEPAAPSRAPPARLLRPHARPVRPSRPPAATTAASRLGGGAHAICWRPRPPLRLDQVQGGTSSPRRPDHARDPGHSRSADPTQRHHAAEPDQASGPRRRGRPRRSRHAQGGPRPRDRALVPDRDQRLARAHAQ
ncbi:hypothetical protein SAMN06264365_13161 [Actinoplanes regularis]|uniref:Uncharacterized protein n=1 Tax=Actinoplanes regularis TaxID=52697 RepID=A0A239IYM0_9ACTN|nr:hypothetical protein SAMN06264365_13161 [Actinoplanes regularis]